MSRRSKRFSPENLRHVSRLAARMGGAAVELSAQAGQPDVPTADMLQVHGSSTPDVVTFYAPDPSNPEKDILWTEQAEGTRVAISFDVE